MSEGAASVSSPPRFTIRMARIEDLEEGLAMYRTFVEETALSAFPFDDEPNVTRLMCESIVKGRCIIGEMADGSIGGLIAVTPQRFPHSTRIFLADSWYYVTPAARSSGLARRLLEGARDYAAKCRLPAIFQPMAGTDPVKVDRFYSILGFTRVGGVYLWRPPDEA